MIRLPCIRRVPEGLIAKIEQAIEGQREAIATYEKLIPLAPNAFHRRQIRGILDDERKHLQMFSELLKKLTGRGPRPGTGEPLPFRTYMEGLRVSFLAELDAAEFYRDIILSTRLKNVQKVFFKAMIDEMEHADRFSFLFADLVRMGVNDDGLRQSSI